MVSDTESSLVFYRDVPGLKVAGQVVESVGCSGAKNAQQDEEVALAGAALFAEKGKD